MNKPIKKQLESEIVSSEEELEKLAAEAAQTEDIQIGEFDIENEDEELDDDYRYNYEDQF